MSDQTSIPVPAHTPAPAVCAWCGEPATADLVVEKPRYRNDRGVRVEARAAVTAPVCAAHNKSIVRSGVE